MFQEIIRGLADNSSVMQHQASEQKVADSGFESQTGNILLYPQERHFMLIFHWDQAVYLMFWTSLTKDLQTEPKKVLSVGVVGHAQRAWFI